MIQHPPHGTGCRGLKVKQVDGSWYRLNRATHPSALHFGRSPTFRWNAPSGEFGTLYVARSVAAAFAETYGHNVASAFPPDTPKYVTEKELVERKVFRITFDRPLQIADFYGSGLASLNLDGQIASTRDYTLTQAWAQWVHDCRQQVDGMLYASRHLPEATCLALFDRCEAHVCEEDLGTVFNWKDAATGEELSDILIAQNWGVVDL